VAGFNVLRFDLRLLASELKRCGLAYSFAEVRVLDAMVLFHRKEPRDLAAAMKFYLRERFIGHEALADAYAAARVLLAQLQRYKDVPTTLPELDDYCRPRTQWLTSRGHLLWKDGAVRFAFGRHAGRSLREVLSTDQQYLRWLLENDFPDDFKAFVQEALEGRVMDFDPRERST